MTADLESMLATVKRAFEPGATDADKTAACGILRAALALLETPPGQQPSLATLAPNVLSTLAPVAAPATAAPSSRAQPDVLGMFLQAIIAKLPAEKQADIARAAADVPSLTFVPLPQLR